MYKIIGADGKEYGPATADQIRLWMASGSVNLETRTQAEGTTEWKLLRDFPELAAAIPTVPPAPFPPPIPAQAGPSANKISSSRGYHSALCHVRHLRHGLAEPDARQASTSPA